MQPGVADFVVLTDDYPLEDSLGDLGLSVELVDGQSTCLSELEGEVNVVVPDLLLTSPY